MEYLYLGRIVNTHGIRGEVRIISSFKYKDRAFQAGSKIYIGKNHDEERIVTYRVHKNFDMTTMDGITNINDVLKYKGKNVFIKRSDLILEDGEFLDEDLIGMNVIISGKIVGVVVKIEKDKHQDKIVVNKEGKDYLVPYVYDIIKSINLEERSITLEDIKGLLD